jgi:hypothetical protein
MDLKATLIDETLTLSIETLDGYGFPTLALYI